MFVDYSVHNEMKKEKLSSKSILDVIDNRRKRNLSEVKALEKSLLMNKSSIEMQLPHIRSPTYYFEP